MKESKLLRNEMIQTKLVYLPMLFILQLSHTVGSTDQRMNVNRMNARVANIMTKTLNPCGQDASKDVV